MFPINKALSNTGLREPKTNASGSHSDSGLVVVCALLVFAQFGTAEPEFGFQGYYKHFSVAIDRHIDNRGLPVSEPPLGIAINRLRLDFSLYATDRIHFGAAYDFAPRLMDPLFVETGSFVVSTSGDRYRVLDPDERLYPLEEDSVRSFSVRHNLDRLNATLRLPFADIIIGRQAVAWGSGKTVAPTDILVPFNITALDVEERLGIDGIRFRIPIGALSEFDAGYVAGEKFDWEKSAGYVRGRFWVWSTDVIPTAIVFGDHLLLGIDLNRAFSGFGTWLETAYTMVDFLGGGDDETRGDYLRATIGADYSVTKNLYGFLEYHYSTAGKNDPDSYPLLFRDVAFTQGGVFLLGRHYASAGMNYQFTPLISGFGQLIYNASDNSFLVGPSVEYNIRSDVYLSLGGYIGVGEQAEVEGRTIKIGSEFGGLYPDQYFAAFRFYF